MNSYEEYDNEDNVFETIDRNNNSNNSNKGSTYNKRSYYTSNVADTYIRNAVTGEKYEWKVGSFDSRRLFRVVDTLGFHDKNGRIITSVKRRGIQTQINHNPNHLFYDSPEEYMKHQHTTIQPELIERWHASKNKNFPDIISEDLS
jgi:hypothetical protein